MIYLDHAATTPPDMRAIRAAEEAMRDLWRNPSSPYAAAGEARRALREARGIVGGMIGASPQEILFTSGGTEGNSQALLLAQGGHAVVGAIEHASVLEAARRVCREVTLVPPDAGGRVSPEAVAAAIRPDTRLISVQLANNETGVLQPAAAIGVLARRARVPFHCDAVQAFGHVPIDVRDMRIDLLTLSAHKFYGVRGAGALFVREGVALRPLLSGGGQERGLRPGTENVPAIVAMGVAAALARDDLAERAGRERALLAGFAARLKAAIPGCAVLGEAAERLPGVAAVLLPGLASEQAIADLDLMGIEVSGGAACASRERAASHVYRAMGLSEADARCVLRVSIGRATTGAALETAADAIAAVYGRRVTDAR